jgi:hypothetical protein
VPTHAVVCSTIWAGDPAKKPSMPELSPEDQAWCAAHSGPDPQESLRTLTTRGRGPLAGGDKRKIVRAEVGARSLCAVR